jgi:peptide/nickel transport system permease protein
VKTILKARLAGVAAAIILLVLLVALFAPILAPYDPAKINVPHRLEGPSTTHLMGTDQNGRDILSRVVYGSRVSVQVGVVAVAIALLVGVPLGLVAGYVGGVVDEALMRIMDAVIAFPAIILALVIVAALGSGVTNVMLAVGIVGTPVFARLVRAQTLSLRELDYVLAARTVGATAPRILLRHIWPNATAPIIVQASLAAGGAIIAEASLSFLGIGVVPPTPTWGGMLQDGFRIIYLSPWLAVFPGIAIYLVVLSLNFLGDAVRDALDPRLRGTR